ncbi:MAG: WYL domain-containing protein [Deltaproteobacteria bacterium]|nr:MAG: WYL domain-containing protein [Deltaproteobacteria bacterium]
MVREVQRGRQVLRQWALLRALEAARRGLTVQELAEVIDQPSSLRTVYRDLEALQDAGFGLESEEGRWRVLREGKGEWNVPVRPTEVLAILFTEQLAQPLQQTTAGEALADLRQRLEAMLTPSGREFVEQMAQLNLASFSAPGAYGEHSAAIDTIQEAIHVEQVLRLSYAKPGEDPEPRDVEPYATWFHNGRLYLIAWCRKNEGVRIFAVQRVVDAEILDETFEPDPSFDVEDFAKSGFGVYQEQAIHRIAVRFAPEVAHLTRERTYHHTQRIREEADGAVVLSFEAAGLPEVAAWIASFGGKLRPISPPALVERVRTLFAEGLASLEAR